MTEAEYLALPPAQRKKFQEELKAKGLYHGPLDAKSGDGVRTALKAMEREKVESEERSRKGRIEEDAAAADAEKKRAEADRERARAETERAGTERKRQYNETAASPEGIATQVAAGPGAFLGGYAAGRGVGSGINKLADISQSSKNKVLQGAAEDRLTGLTTRDGSRTGTSTAGAMPSQNALLRVGGRMLPHAITGASMIGKGGAMLAQGNEDDPFYAQMANRGAGIGMIGTGVGVLEQGANYAVNPGVAPDARSIAIIESNQLRRNGTNRLLDRGNVIDAEVVPNAPEQAALPAPDKAAPQPGSKAYYVQEAKRLGVKGATRKSKADLVQAVNDANAGNATKRVRGPKKLPVMAGPLAAASLAYAATPSDANASTGDDSVTGQDEALTNAAIAGGATYGVGQMLPKMAGQAIGTGLSMAAPSAAVDMTDDFASPEARNWAARNFPEALQFGAVGAARDMAQVPERSPANSGPRVDDFAADLADLARMLTELEGPAQPQRSAPAMMPAPNFSTGQQNRLLAGR